MLGEFGPLPSARRTLALLPLARKAAPANKSGKLIGLAGGELNPELVVSSK